MNISTRLNRLAEMVTEGSRLADVGTDHGYVPLCLCRQGKIPSAIAMDIGEGPLERAKEHIREAGLGNYIETRLSDGLSALEEGEADTILIAGMGGALMERILDKGGKALEFAKELVLQPQSEIWKVRRWLAANGWRIVCEDIVLDEGKFYPMFQAEKGCPEKYNEQELLFGKSALQSSPQVMREFLEKRLKSIRKIREGLPEGREESRIRNRREELEKEIKLLERTLLEYRKGKGISDEVSGDNRKD